MNPNSEERQGTGKQSSVKHRLYVDDKRGPLEMLARKDSIAYPWLSDRWAQALRKTRIPSPMTNGSIMVDSRWGVGEAEAHKRGVEGVTKEKQQGKQD